MIPTTGISKTDWKRLVTLGIGTMAIGTTFIVG
jgi:hypothetical protein